MKILHSSPTHFLMLTLLASAILFVQCNSETKETPKQVVNETILKAPEGFSVYEIGKDLGAVRHLTVAPDGDIYANRKALKDGKAIVALKDKNNDGKIDSQENFGELPGTEVLAKNGYLYASSNSGIYRYKMNDNHELIDTSSPEKIVDGLIDMGRDNAKPFTMDDSGNIYVTVGSWNDPCRDAEDKTGMNPCTILDSAGGIWKFRADKLNQTYADGSRYVTGLKNPVGLDWNSQTNSLFATDHGRGKLHLYYPDLYTQQQDNDLPAETFYEL
ncbi:MAG: sorbosone dehydrogenase, partial [Cyclobacteriaceae bacterium]